MKNKTRKQIKSEIHRIIKNKLNNKFSSLITVCDNEVQELIDASVNSIIDNLYFDDITANINNISADIAEKELPSINKKLLASLEAKIKQRQHQLDQDKFNASKMDKKILWLEQLVHKKKLGQLKYWGGADIIIIPKEIDKNKDPLILFENHRLVTETEHTAATLSWLFKQVGKIMSPWVNFATKYGFYSQLAQAVEVIIKTKENYNDNDLYNAVIIKTKEIKTTLETAYTEFYRIEQEKINQDKHQLNQIKYNT